MIPGPKQNMTKHATRNEKGFSTSTTVGSAANTLTDSWWTVANATIITMIRGTTAKRVRKPTMSKAPQKSSMMPTK